MKILVCTDGSEQADKAIRLICEIARFCQAEVTLFGIKETAGDSETILEALRRGQRLLEGFGVAAELVIKAGNAITEIVKRTNEVNCDMVVIGAVQKGGRVPFSMSAKAYRIVKLTKPPVLVVMGNPTGLKRVLICSGRQADIETGIALVGKIAQKAGASASLLHVMPRPPAIYSEIRMLEQDINLILNSNSKLGRNLRRQKELLTAAGVETEVWLRQGFVLDEIFQEMQAGHYDLIVAGSSLSAGPLRTYVLGDVTREIVNRADCPVLIARHGQRSPHLKDKLRGLFWRRSAVILSHIAPRCLARNGSSLMFPPDHFQASREFLEMIKETTQ